MSEYLHTNVHSFIVAPKTCTPLMDHLLHALAQHWHLSAKQYWQMHLLCSVSFVPFLGVLYLLLFNRRNAPGRLRVTLVKRQLRALTQRPAAPAPMQPTVNPS